MTQRRVISGGAIAVMALLAACDSNDDKDVAAPPPPVVVVPPPPENAFGANFGTAFRAGPNDPPRDVADGDIIALSFTENARPVG